MPVRIPSISRASRTMGSMLPDSTPSLGTAVPVVGFQNLAHPWADGFDGASCRWMLMNQLERDFVYNLYSPTMLGSFAFLSRSTPWRSLRSGCHRFSTHMAGGNPNSTSRRSARRVSRRATQTTIPKRALALSEEGSLDTWLPESWNWRESERLISRQINKFISKCRPLQDG